ncbi:hypothetical protein SAMN06297387_10752 [Streptomyces zhaozhouensis]|uniref:Uncharacterized protein n=1 Tax=Streptomyces zhaozhouensis TaxID=1300267 RepID=A0A286DVG9_9ACTN|nr:hypothetical protein [Streptomyces zhaozhouensis]SOD62679.1 hypothetical protein SAMN06297387_10752 [Streptomyces zhaozhouensis]
MVGRRSLAGMQPTVEDLAERVRARGLPEAVVTIATRGGEVVHPDLEYRAQAVGGPSWSVIGHSARADLVPLWTCGTTTLFSTGDGTFLEWDAEEDEPSRTFPDFPATVRSLLTDLYEDELDDDALRTIGELLLAPHQVNAALRPEDR